MKKLILMTLSTFLLAENVVVDGLERAMAQYKRDACEKAKSRAKENYDVKDINAECTCEKSDSREWMCFVRFKHLPKTSDK
ncbi:hypothetical protein KKG72_01235 [bacterium]|nr:hypothetical protein [bacterium]MBU1994889.1 hypothetical protein [bacterium]